MEFWNDSLLGINVLASFGGTSINAYSEFKNRAIVFYNPQIYLPV